MNQTQTESMRFALEALEGLINRTSAQAIYSFMETERRIAISACVGLREALAEQPAPVQQGGLEMVDDEGENQAVRMFLALYGGACGVTSEQMRKHLKMAGFDGAWPEWANSNNGHLTKAGAQLWIRHLFALAEQPAQAATYTCGVCGVSMQMEQPSQQQEPVAWAFLNGQYAHIVWGKQRPDDEIHTIPLYTSPPASKPLTDEQLADFLGDEYHAMTAEEERYFRLAEVAHGIKEQP